MNISKNKLLSGHLLALFTCSVWGTTFVSTKVLLNSFDPVEILFFRFVIALLFLNIIYPRRMHCTDIRRNLMMAGAGLCGVCLYYLLENIALTYTYASNTGVVLSVAPMFTAIVARLSGDSDERLTGSFFTGFAVAMAGIIIISFNGAELHLNPFGDLLAVGAALVWAFYSVLVKKINSFGYHTVQITRRIFLYGIIFMLPSLKIFGFRLDLYRFADSVNMANILFLGLGASAICFVTWNLAVKYIGAIKSSIYIYLSPAVTVAASAIILKEQITPLALTGTLLTIAGLVISELRFSDVRELFLKLTHSR